MSGITQFTAKAIVDANNNSALQFKWAVGSDITVSNISKINITLNDFGSGPFLSYPVSPVTTTNDNTLVTTVVDSFNITTYNNANIQSGVTYSASLHIQLNDNTTYNKQTNCPAKSLPTKPNIEWVAGENFIKYRPTNLTSGNHVSTGHTDITKIHVFLSNADAKTLQVFSFTTNDSIGNNYTSFHTLTNGVIYNGTAAVIPNNIPMEVALYYETEMGSSPMSDTTVVTPSDRPNIVAPRIALPTILTGSNVKSATVYFGNAGDVSNLASTSFPVLNYKVNRYEVDSNGGQIESTKTLIQTVVTNPSSGLSATPDISYNYAGQNYSFRVLDSSVVLGTIYKYSVTGYNANGEGVESFMPNMRAGVLADAPALTLTPADGAISASSVRPSNMGGFLPYAIIDSSSISYYFKYTFFYLDASNIKQGETTVTSAASPVQLGGSLVNGRQYTVESQAITIYEGVDYFGAKASATSVPAGPAPAPQNLSLKTFDVNGPLNGAIDASWNAVTSKNGSTGAITYSVLVQDSSSVYQVFASGITGTTYRLTGLTNGQSYSIKVRADVFNTEISQNIAGTQSSAASATPFRLPGPATNLALTRPGDASLNFAFDASAVLTGLGSAAAVSQVVIRELSGDVLAQSYVASYTSDASQYILYGTGRLSQNYLGTKGKSYQFDVYTGVTQGGVTYYNAVPQTISGTSHGIPSAPQNFQAVPLSGGAVLTWDAPADLNGTTISGYKVYLGASLYATVSALPEYYVITGLSNETLYTVRLAATCVALNEINIDSPFANSVQVLPSIAPDQPSGLAFSPEDGTVTLSWARNTSVAGYRVLKNDNPLSSQNISGLTGSSGSWSWTQVRVSYVASGLTNGTSYSFKVSAYTSAGVYSLDTKFTPDPIPYAAPSAPTSLVCTVGSNTINSTWSAPTTPAGAGLAGNSAIKYRMIIDASYADVSGNVSTPVTGTVYTEQTITGLSFNLTNSTALLNGKRYLVNVYAYFTSSTGVDYVSLQPAQVAVIVNPAPQDVSGLLVTPGNRTNVLTWSNPTDTAIYTRDRIDIYRTYNGAETLLHTTSNVATTTYTDSSLANGGLYTYRVVSHHNASTAQQPSGVVASGMPFGKPILVSADPNSSGHATYTLQINKNGSNLLDYVAVGALPDGSGNVDIPVKSGSFTGASYGGAADVNGAYAAGQLCSFTLQMGENVDAIMVIIENAAGFTIRTIPTGRQTLFGQL